MSEYSKPPPPSTLSFPSTETQVLDFWQTREVFEMGSAFLESLERNKDKPKYSFYDGPPFASGDPHHGHILAGTIKDVVTRYAHQTGHNVPRNFGWDCHGVPVENEINKKHNIKRRQDVLEQEGRGVKWYNDECRSIVMRCVDNWRSTTRRIGRWIDFDNDYKTMDHTFMESVWSVFRRLYDLNLVYSGERVMPVSTALGTPMSKHEVGPETYAEVQDPSVVVSFKILDDPHQAEFVAWTTTPWTLPSNVALCVNAEMQYIKIRDVSKDAVRAGRVFVIAVPRLEQIYKVKGPKQPQAKEEGEAAPTESASAPVSVPASKDFEVLEGPFPGSHLKGWRYEPLFGFFSSPSFFQVVCDDYVTSTSGTGIVHLAPAFGEDDHRVCLANKIVAFDEPLPCPVDDEGFYTASLVAQTPDDEFGKSLVGKHVKTKEEGNANSMIRKQLKGRGRLLVDSSTTHKVPLCSRSKTPLIYKAIKSWFIRVESGTLKMADGSERNLRDLMMELNEDIHWVPDFVGKKRFHEWLAQARDWNVSRNRFWGTPIPIWQSEDGEERVCVGSIEELKQLAGLTEDIPDIHREFVDNIQFRTRPDGPLLKRVPELFDCWFESGSMPYATSHYMFEPGNDLQVPPTTYPADFIAEGLDQTRGWFYTLLILSTALFQKAPFKNVVVNGLVLAADGKKMSKSLKNFPDPNEVINRHGADALRLYLINSPVVRAEPLRFVEEGVSGNVREVFIPWLNSLRFLVQNVRRLHSHSPQAWKSSDLCQERAERSKNMMDAWIMAELRDLIRVVRKEMESYHLYNVLPRLRQFIDSLKDWYVRLNRNRFKGSSKTGSAEDEEDGDEGAGTSNGDIDVEDTLAALSTLFVVLSNLARLMAPVAPFFSEYSYQQLYPDKDHAGVEKSVHFTTMPEPVPQTEADLKLLRKVHTLQKAVQQGRNSRAGTKLKWPVVKVLLLTDDAQVREDLRELEAYVKEELNVFELEFPEDLSSWASFQVVCNNATFGSKYRADKNKVKARIETLEDPKALFETLSAGDEFEIIPGLPKLQQGDVTVTRELSPTVDKDRYGVDSSLELMVITDKTVTEDVLRHGVLREFRSIVQKLRKRSGLSPEDKVNVFCQVSGESGDKVEKLLKNGSEFVPDFENPEETGVIVVTGKAMKEPLLDSKAFVDVYLVRPFVRMLNKDLPRSVHYLLSAIGWEQLKDKQQMDLMVNGTRYLLRPGLDFSSSVM